MSRHVTPSRPSVGVSSFQLDLDVQESHAVYVSLWDAAAYMYRAGFPSHLALLLFLRPVIRVSFTVAVAVFVLLRGAALRLLPILALLTAVHKRGKDRSVS